jgi:hypothetical protein
LHGWEKKVAEMRGEYDRMKRWQEKPCEICGHAIHPLCNNANCDTPHPDPQNAPEPPDYE